MVKYALTASLYIPRYPTGMPSDFHPTTTCFFVEFADAGGSRIYRVCGDLLTKLLEARRESNPRIKVLQTLRLLANIRPVEPSRVRVVGGQAIPLAVLIRHASEWVANAADS